MTRAQDVGTTVGRGRRMDSSFGSPAGRACRDGNEGLRGDGRPPVGIPPRTIHSSIEKEVILRPPRLSVRRPATSLDTTARNNPSSDKIVACLEPLRKLRSLENLVPPKSVEDEISKTRARLRSVKRPSTSYPTSTEGRSVGSDSAGDKNKPSQDSFDDQNILNELDDLLIGALERAKTAAGNEFAETTNNTTSKSFPDESTTPQQSFCSHSKARASSAADQSRLHTMSCHRRSPSKEPFMHDNNTDTDALDYIDMPTDQGPAEPTSKDEQDHLRWAPSPRKGPSPVKARAALFERMHYDFPGEYIHDRHYLEHAVPTSTVKSIRKRLEAENSIPISVHNPPIELALPQLISHPRRHSQRSSGPGDSESYQCETAKQFVAMSPSTARPKDDTRVSFPWPLKWNLFPQDKATPAPPKPSGVEAKAETGHGERVTDSSMEHIMNHIYVSPAKLALSPMLNPTQKPLVIGDTEGQGVTEGVQERVKVFTEGRTSKTAASQSLQELQSDAQPKEPQTPKRETDLISAQLMTPTKSGTVQLKPSTTTSSPSTPFRGRTRSGHRDSFAVEQRYSLSRSRSRGGLKILLEVRSPDPTPDRSDNDTIIIVRANVEPLEE
jgi:hypothetical protein